MRINILMTLFITAIGMLLSVHTPMVFAVDLQPADGYTPKTKDEQSRQIQIDTERLKMELAEKSDGKKAS